LHRPQLALRGDGQPERLDIAPVRRHRHRRRRALVVHDERRDRAGRQRTVHAQVAVDDRPGGVGAVDARLADPVRAGEV
jgi:hypothetical protein